MIFIYLILIYLVGTVVTAFIIGTVNEIDEEPYFIAVFWPLGLVFLIIADVGSLVIVGPCKLGYKAGKAVSNYIERLAEQKIRRTFDD